MYYCSFFSFEYWLFQLFAMVVAGHRIVVAATTTPCYSNSIIGGHSWKNEVKTKGKRRVSIFRSAKHWFGMLNWKCASCLNWQLCSNDNINLLSTGCIAFIQHICILFSFGLVGSDFTLFLFHLVCKIERPKKRSNSYFCFFGRLCRFCGGNGGLFWESFWLLFKMRCTDDCEGFCFCLQSSISIQWISVCLFCIWTIIFNMHTCAYIFIYSWHYFGLLLLQNSANPFFEN